MEVVNFDEDVRYSTSYVSPSMIKISEEVDITKLVSKVDEVILRMDMLFSFHPFMWKVEMDYLNIEGCTWHVRVHRH